MEKSWFEGKKERMWAGKKNEAGIRREEQAMEKEDRK